MSHDEQQKPQNIKWLKIWAVIYAILIIVAIIYSQVWTHSHPEALVASSAQHQSQVNHFVDHRH